MRNKKLIFCYVPHQIKKYLNDWGPIYLIQHKFNVPSFLCHFMNCLNKWCSLLLLSSVFSLHVHNVSIVVLFLKSVQFREYFKRGCSWTRKTSSSDRVHIVESLDSNKDIQKRGSTIRDHFKRLAGEYYLSSLALPSRLFFLYLKGNLKVSGSLFLSYICFKCH